MTTTTILSFFVILFCLMSQANAWESWNITDPDSGLPCLTLETDAIEFMLRYNESNKTHAYTAKLIKTISMKGNCSVFHNNATYSIIEAIILVRTNEHDAVHESWTVKFWFQKMDDTTMKKSRNIRGYREDYGFLNAFNLARYELITASTKESPHPSNISYAELERLDMRDSQLDNGIKCSELMLLFSDNSMITFRGLDFFILVKNDDGHYVVHRIYNLCSMDQELIAYSTSDFLAIGVIIMEVSDLKMPKEKPSKMKKNSDVLSIAGSLLLIIVAALSPITLLHFYDLEFNVVNGFKQIWRKIFIILAVFVLFIINLAAITILIGFTRIGHNLKIVTGFQILNYMFIWVFGFAEIVLFVFFYMENRKCYLSFEADYLGQMIVASIGTTLSGGMTICCVILNFWLKAHLVVVNGRKQEKAGVLDKL